MTNFFQTARKAILFSLVFLVFPFFANAQEQRQRLSPDEAVSLAIRNNLTLESSRVSTSTRKRKADNAWNVFIPTVDLSTSLSGTLNKPEAPQPIPLIPNMPPISLMPQTPQWSSTLPSISVTWQNLNVALFEGMKAVKEDYAIGVLSYEKAKAQIERDVRKAYYNILLLYENISLLKESFKSAERRVDMAQANYRAGRAPELTYLQAQVAMENMKPTINQAENGLRVSMVQFAIMLGLPYDTDFELIPIESISDFVELDVKEIISNASRSKPDILEIKQNIRFLESRRKATFYQLHTPNLMIGWSIGPTIWNDVSGWNWNDGWKNTNAGRLTIALSFRLNTLLPFGSEQSGLKDIDDNLRSLQIGLAQSIRGTELEIYSIILDLEKVQTTIEAQKRTVELAERSFRLTETAYRAGLQDLLEVQNAELELRKARIGILEQNFTYLRALIDLEYAMGVPFGTLSGSL